MIHTIADFVIKSGGKLKDLVSLAISSRSLTNVALDVLWEKQIYLDVLIRCFPDDLWRIEEDVHLQGRKYFVSLLLILLSCLYCMYTSSV